MGISIFPASSGGDISSSIINAKGDLLVGTAGDTVSRLAVGTNDYVLTAASGETTGLKWAAAAGWSPNYTLLNAGGTSTSGSGTITVSGISGKNSLLIAMELVSTSSANLEIDFRLNADSGSNYKYANTSTSTATFLSDTSDNGVRLATLGNSASNTVTGYIWIYGTGTAGIKPFTFVCGSSATGTLIYNGTGAYVGSSAITSFSLITSGGTFDSGTLYVYGA